MPAELLPEEPSELDREPVDSDDASDPDDEDIPCTDDFDDDARWEVFIPDDDERDPEPDPGDFWIESKRKDKERNGSSRFGFVSV